MLKGCGFDGLWLVVTRNQLTAEQGRFALPLLNEADILAQMVDGPVCSPVAKCSSSGGSIYRTLDGSCNNVLSTDWGKAGTALERIIPPKYGDGDQS